MTLESVLVWVLRAWGLLYLLAGLWGMRQSFFWGRLEPDMDKLLDMMDAMRADTEGQPPAPPRKTDHNRHWWLFSGCVLLALAGGAMIVAHRSAAVLLALLIVHQMIYFIRQRRRELTAGGPEEAEEARPAQSTVNGFFVALVIALMTGWLYWRGALL